MGGKNPRIPSRIWGEKEAKYLWGQRPCPPTSKALPPPTAGSRGFPVATAFRASSSQDLTSSRRPSPSPAPPLPPPHPAQSLGPKIRKNDRKRPALATPRPPHCSRGGRSLTEAPDSAPAGGGEVTAPGRPPPTHTPSPAWGSPPHSPSPAHLEGKRCR